MLHDRNSAQMVKVTLFQLELGIIMAVSISSRLRILLGLFPNKLVSNLGGFYRLKLKVASLRIIQLLDCMHREY